MVAIPRPGSASLEQKEELGSHSVCITLHAACILPENQIFQSITGDSEGTPAEGHKLVALNIRGGTALSLRVNTTS